MKTNNTYKMKKFIYTSIEKKDFGQTPKKELICTSYSNTRFDETVEILTKALNLAKERIRTVRTVKEFEFWSKQESKATELLNKQHRLRTHELKVLDKLTKDMFGEQYTFDKMSEREQGMVKQEYNYPTYDFL